MIQEPPARPCAPFTRSAGFGLGIGRNHANSRPHIPPLNLDHTSAYPNILNSVAITGIACKYRYYISYNHIPTKCLSYYGNHLPTAEIHRFLPLALLCPRFRLRKTGSQQKIVDSGPKRRSIGLREATVNA
jgi:hypothetical protein